MNKVAALNAAAAASMAKEAAVCAGEAAAATASLAQAFHATLLCVAAGSYFTTYTLEIVLPCVVLLCGAADSR